MARDTSELWEELGKLSPKQKAELARTLSILWAKIWMTTLSRNGGDSAIGLGDMTANQSLQPTANPLRGLSAAELGRYAATRDDHGHTRQWRES